MEAVVREFGDRNPREDPVIHFYEEFVKQYDRSLWRGRGVFYTPRPVVSYIVRSVDEQLRTAFGLKDGLADTTTWEEMATLHKALKIPQGVAPSQDFVQILDPAAGTGTFLVEVIDFIHKTLATKWKAEGYTELEIETLWNQYVPEHLLTRLCGYELLMAPYAVAHLKIGLKLYETGYRFGSDERARVFLTNALEPPSDQQLTLDFLPALAHEAQAVNEVKRKQPFSVVIGNPPYAKLSANRSKAAEKLVETYKQLVSEERNVQPLSDDYVKFMALGTGLVLQASMGVIGLITNRGWLDGLIHRGMRASLLGDFDRVLILDCHGDSNVGEAVPQGCANDNLFDIQQGVAVSLFVRCGSISTNAVLRTGDLWGSREEKYGELLRSSALSLTHEIDIPGPPNCFFRQIGDRRTADSYGAFWSLTDVFGSGNRRADQGKAYGNGIKSNRDALLVDFDRQVLLDRMARLADLSLSDEAVKSDLGLQDGPYWNTARERRKVEPSKATAYLRPITYRPFDERWIWYQADLIQIGRGGASPKLMRNLIETENNVALLTSRNSQNPAFSSVFCTRHVSEMKTAESTRASYCFPLFMCSSDDAEREHDQSARVNLSQGFTRALQSALQGGRSEELKAEHVFFFIYSILHSPNYRSRHAEFLSVGFPRIPLPRSADLFSDLARLGGELVSHHLMESPKLNDVVTTYTGQKNPTVGRAGWSDGTAWLDARRTNAREGHRAIEPGVVGFTGVPAEVWNFEIGGYQVCHKWLKDRKGRTLSNDDITHYQKIVVALDETIRIMDGIDRAIESHGGWPDAFEMAGSDSAGSPIEGRLI